MNGFVIDASAALAWVLESQATDASTAFLKGAEPGVFIAPHIFGWEMRNVLLTLKRRRALSPGAYREALSSLDALRVGLQAPLNEPEIRDLADLAQDVGLSLFDAAYLALAVARSSPLVSRDDRLLDVASGEVQFVDLREVR